MSETTSEGSFKEMLAKSLDKCKEKNMTTFFEDFPLFKEIYSSFHEATFITINHYHEIDAILIHWISCPKFEIGSGLHEVQLWKENQAYPRLMIKNV